MKTVEAQGHDLAIPNGRMMDVETNFDAVRNVGVRGGKIVTVTQDRITDRETIDATGHIVTAGFIDTHFRWMRPMGRKLGLRDGVTTAMDLEFGTLGPAIPASSRASGAGAAGRTRMSPRCLGGSLRIVEW